MPDAPAPGAVHPVRPADLARDYRDRPAVAGAAYDGVRVVLPIGNCRPRPGGLGWALGAAPASSPVVLLDFAGPVPADPRGLWAEGTCRGRADDDVRRDGAYTFTVRVTDCRVVPAPVRR